MNLYKRVAQLKLYHYHKNGCHGNEFIDISSGYHLPVKKVFYFSQVNMFIACFLKFIVIQKTNVLLLDPKHSAFYFENIWFFIQKKDVFVGIDVVEFHKDKKKSDFQDLQIDFQSFKNTCAEFYFQ